RRVRPRPAAGPAPLAAAADGHAAVGSSPGGPRRPVRRGPGGPGRGRPAAVRLRPRPAVAILPLVAGHCLGAAGPAASAPPAPPEAERRPRGSPPAGPPGAVRPGTGRAAGPLAGRTP